MIIGINIFVQELSLHGNIVCGTREALHLAWSIATRPARRTLGGTAVMHGGRESDSSRVPMKRPNKVEGHTTMRSREQAEAAEAVEGRELAKGKTGEHTRVRTQSRNALQRALDRIR